MPKVKEILAINPRIPVINVTTLKTTPAIADSFLLKDPEANLETVNHPVQTQGNINPKLAIFAYNKSRATITNPNKAKIPIVITPLPPQVLTTPTSSLAPERITQPETVPA